MSRFFLRVNIMAIQTINLTVPGGDTPRSANTKINANFTDPTNAASKLIGKSTGQVPLSENVQSLACTGSDKGTSGSFDTLPNGAFRVYRAESSDWTQRPPFPAGGQAHALAITRTTDLPSVKYQMVLGYTGGLFTRAFQATAWTTWEKYYSSGNTTVDGNGLLKPSSPVLRVFSDHIEGNEDADIMQAVFTKNGVGDYTISNTTGLRTDGWYITIPNDMNGNPKVAVTLSEKDGVVSLKSYKRIFDMNDFIFKPDLEQPLDVPDGRWIDLRFEDLTHEDNGTSTEF